MSAAAINKAKKLAKAEGLELVRVSEVGGHFQVRGGAMLVNWYPFSANQTAYVNATKRGIKHATPEQVIKMALTAPDVQAEKVTRNSGKASRAKRRLLKTRPFCHWCDIELTAETATLEHIVPLKRGGLDHHNNMTLACKPCNEGRGHDMPELNIHDKAKFEQAFNNLDATNEPEAIRNIIDEDERIELTSKQTGKWLYIEKGEIKQVES